LPEAEYEFLQFVSFMPLNEQSRFLVISLDIAIELFIPGENDFEDF
jgi:hypothetical protein